MGRRRRRMTGGRIIRCVSIRHFFGDTFAGKRTQTGDWGCAPTSIFSYFAQSGKCEKTVSVYTLALLAIP